MKATPKWNEKWRYSKKRKGLSNENEFVLNLVGRKQRKRSQRNWKRKCRGLNTGLGNYPIPCSSLCIFVFSCVAIVCVVFCLLNLEQTHFHCSSLCVFCYSVIFHFTLVLLSCGISNVACVIQFQKLHWVYNFVVKYCLNG